MSDLVIADTSEFQSRINWQAYVAGGFLAAIIRAHNGYRADYQFVANRSGAHAAAIRALGMYQYVVAGRDAAAQANELCDLVGELQPGEWLICDLEEGSGDQEARGHAWLSTVVNRLHDAGTAEELYSGGYFLLAHNLSAAGFRRIWVASYGTAEPGIPHEEWQFTDAHSFPGISGATDASIFHGTIGQLLARIGTSSTTTPAEDTMPQWINGSITPGAAPVVALVPAGDAWKAFTHRTLHLGMDEPGVAGAHAAVRVAVHKGGADWDRVVNLAVTAKEGTVSLDITGAVKVSLQTPAAGVSYSIETW